MQKHIKVTWLFVRRNAFVYTLKVQKAKLSSAETGIFLNKWVAPIASHRPLTKYVNCGLRMRRECRERFPRHRLKKKPWSRHASRHVRHARAVMHVGITIPRWRGKRSRHSRRMRNPQCYVSGKRPMSWLFHLYDISSHGNRYLGWPSHWDEEKDHHTYIWF